jgi:RNA polymerase sigma-70 factor (ECF subfamily)
MPATDDTTIEDLLRRARAGEAAALDQLFGRCRNYLAVVARAQVESWLRAKADASDLVQQTLLDAYKAFGRFEGATEGEWLAWLRAIATHNAADHVRRYGTAAKRRAGREVPLAPPAGASSCAAWQPAAPAETPSQQLVRAEGERQVADALARLSEDHRTVIELRNLQRLPFDEVARRMGRSRPAVQMLWMRALQKLREQLGAEAGEDGAG